MTDTIRIGILGAGGNTRDRHIPGLREQPGVEVVAVCNRSLESSRKVCEQLDIPRACGSPQEIIDADDIDAVVIGTWPYKHCAFTVAALEAGKHVMCEARMAMNAVEAERMVAAARSRPELVAQIVPSPFSLPFDDQLAKIVKDRLGELRAVRMELVIPNDGHERPPRTWRRNRALSGNNIMTIGIWYEAVMRWVGPARTIHALFATHRPVGVDPDTQQEVVIDIPDHVEAIGELARGGVLSLTASCTAALPPGNRITVTGSSGSIFYDGSKASFTPTGGKAEAIEPNASKGWRVVAEFIGAIRGEERIVLTDFDTGLAYMRLTDALHESHRLGQTVRVPT